MADCPLVIIRWLDSRQPSGQWRYLSDLPEVRPVEVASVGWLLRDTAEAMVICQNVGDLEAPNKAQASGIMTIPTRCVLSVERLTEVERGTNAFAAPGSVGIAGSGNFAAISEDLEIATTRMPQAL
ncbi:MAG: hypothetical protein JSR78_09055 [Proteobacteria bacterium]|nr:hypothetical protein [Pseudomonadota bacterium]